MSSGDERRTGEADELRWFGRRHGHKLRPHRQALIDDLLPKLRVTLPEDGRALDPARLFTCPVDDVWLEIGFGAGEHLAAQARNHTEIGFIGCEPFVNGVAALLAKLDEDGPTETVRLFDDDARPLLDALNPASIGRAFILFADPWPKARHHRRRFINPGNLDRFARILRDGAELRFASDHPGYVRWALSHFLRHPAFEWTAERADDWRRRPRDGVPTRYETKALANGIACTYLTFRRKPR